MVRYLGVNYLDQATKKKKSFVQEKEIPVPNHLERIGKYPHNGQLIDERFKFPWKRVHVEKDFLQNEAQKLDLLGPDVTLTKTANSASKSASLLKIEEYQSEHEDHNQHGMFDFLSDSQEDLFAISPQKTNDCDGVNDICSEKFVREKTDEAGKADGDIWTLEAPITQDIQKYLMRNFPRLTTMVQQLKANLVPDPFNILCEKSNGDVASLKNVEAFCEDNCKDTNITRQNVLPPLFDDEFNEEKDNSLKEMEEILSPFSQCQPTSFSLMETDLFQELQSIDTDVTGVHTLQEELKCLQREVKGRSRSDIEEFHFPLSQQPQPLSVTEDKEDNILKYLFDNSQLDEPLFLSKGNNSSFVDILALVKSLEPEVIDSDEKIVCLDAEGKTEMTERIWMWEKECCFVSGLLIWCPKTDSRLEHSFGPLQAMSLLKLNKCNDIGSVELALNWDALLYTSCDNQKRTYIETLSDHVDQEGKPQPASQEALTTTPFVEEHQCYDRSSIYEPWKNKSKRKLPESPNNVNAKEKASTVSVVKKVKSSSVIEPTLGGSLGVDPLQDFFLLRNVDLLPPKGETTQPKTPDVARNPTSTPGMIAADLSVKRKIAPPTPQHNASSCRPWVHQIIPVHLNGPYRSLLSLLQDQIDMCVTVLKNHKELADTCTGNSIAKETSRFLLKQKEKQLSDTSGGSCGDTYKYVAMLHSLVCARELLLHCCFESCLLHLNVMQDKYKDVLQGSMDTLRKELFDKKYLFDQKQIVHPKFEVLYKEMHNSYKKNGDSKGNGRKEKILITVRHDLDSLRQTIKTFLNGDPNISTEVVTATETSDAMKNVVENNDVIICSVEFGDQKGIPLKGISLVIEYEDIGGTTFQDTCRELGLPLITLKTVVDGETTLAPSHPHPFPTDYNSCEAKESQNKGNTGPYCPMTVIGSRKLIENTELLQLLEARYSLTILERDYMSLGCEYDCDVAIDEASCILLQPLDPLTEPWSVDSIMKRLLAMSVQFAFCWLILYAGQTTQRYMFSGSVLLNINKLQAACCTLTNNFQEFRVKTVVCEDTPEMAQVMRRSCDLTWTANTTWDPRDWIRRDWLSEEPSQAEKTLLVFPSLNAFSAQLMLRKFSLGELLRGVPLEELQHKLPWIPTHSLQFFLQAIHRCSSILMKNASPSASLKGLGDNFEETLSNNIDWQEHNLKNKSPMVATGGRNSFCSVETQSADYMEVTGPGTTRHHPDESDQSTWTTKHQSDQSDQSTWTTRQQFDQSDQSPGDNIPDTYGCFNLISPSGSSDNALWNSPTDGGNIATSPASLAFDDSPSLLHGNNMISHSNSVKSTNHRPPETKNRCVAFSDDHVDRLRETNEVSALQEKFDQWKASMQGSVRGGSKYHGNSRDEDAVDEMFKQLHDKPLEEFERDRHRPVLAMTSVRVGRNLFTETGRNSTNNTDSTYRRRIIGSSLNKPHVSVSRHDKAGVRDQSEFKTNHKYVPSTLYLHQDVPESNSRTLTQRDCISSYQDVHYTLGQKFQCSNEQLSPKYMDSGNPCTSENSSRPAKYLNCNPLMTLDQASSPQHLSIQTSDKFPNNWNKNSLQLSADTVTKNWDHNNDRFESYTLTSTDRHVGFQENDSSHQSQSLQSKSQARFSSLGNSEIAMPREVLSFNSSITHQTSSFSEGNQSYTGMSTNAPFQRRGWNQTLNSTVNASRFTEPNSVQVLSNNTRTSIESSFAGTSIAPSFAETGIAPSFAGMEATRPPLSRKIHKIGLAQPLPRAPAADQLESKEIPEQIQRPESMLHLENHYQGGQPSRQHNLEPYIPQTPKHRNTEKHQYQGLETIRLHPQQKKLTFEKTPGLKGGQTKLVFKH